MTTKKDTLIIIIAENSFLLALLYISISFIVVGQEY